MKKRYKVTLSKHDAPPSDYLIVVNLFMDDDSPSAVLRTLTDLVKPEFLSNVDIREATDASTQPDESSSWASESEYTNADEDPWSN